MTAMMSLEEALSKASLAELQANMPALVALTEHPDAPVRFAALFLFNAIAPGNPTNPPIDHHTYQDGVNLLIPFIPRLTHCLNDPDPHVRSTCLALMANLTLFIRPTPPLLLEALLKNLADPGSTKPAFTSDTDPRDLPRDDLIMGPQIVGALIPVNATVEVDPVTNKLITKNDPDVMAAILRFLHRPDQTSQSLGATINSIAVVGLTGPDFNAELLSFLDYPDDSVRMVLVHDLNQLILPASAVPAIKSRLTQLASDPSTSAELRVEVGRVLPCWNNDQTQMCPPFQINTEPPPAR